MIGPDEDTKPDADAPEPRKHESSSGLRRMLEKNPWDAPGAIVMYSFAILGVFHVPEALGLTGDDVSVLIGSIAGLGATIRGLRIHRNGQR